MALHMYCVLRSGHPVGRDLHGVGEPPGPVSLVTDGPLSAAVSPIADTAELSEADALRHLDLLVELLFDGPVLPLRFGTVAPDRQAVISEVLRPAAGELQETLDALDGLVELQLVVRAREDDELAAVIAEHPDLRARAADAARLPVGERIGLGEVIEAELSERRRRRSELIDQVLEPHCRAILDLSSGDPTTSKLAVLVQVTQLDDFDSVVSGLFNDLGPGYQSEYIGPLPAADFVGIARPTSRSDETWGWSGSESPTGKWGW